MHNISIRKIGVFISAADTGSFTEGARRSNISQPAAVSIIDEIERTVGEELFIRNGKARRAALTGRGREVYDTLIRAKVSYDQALDSISTPTRRRACQTVLIQIPYVSLISFRWLQRIISNLNGRRVCIRAVEWSQIIAAIERKETCMAVIDGDFSPKDREYLQICTCEMVIVTSDFSILGNSVDNSINWEDIPRGTFIYTGINPAANERVYDNLKGMTGADRDQFTEVNCPSILRGFIEHYEVTAIVPRLMVKSLQTDASRVRCLQFSQSRVHLQLGLLMPFDYGTKLRMSRSEFRNAFDQEVLL